MTGTTCQSAAITPRSTYCARTAIATAHHTLRNLDWFEVINIRGGIKDGAVSEFQVTIKVGFRYQK
ncbi:MAG: dodecin domain-containing protein [Alphaproteobacteria bacterium]|nr:dodecin domain-containing protein [Alphaproteobacteria bacterium]